jgi:hypothetical protein
MVAEGAGGVAAVVLRSTPALATPLPCSSEIVVIGGTLDSVVESTRGMAPAIETALAATRPSPSADAAPAASQPRAVVALACRARCDFVISPVSRPTPGRWVRVFS